MILRDHDTNGDGTYDARHYVHHDANYNVTSLTDDAGDVVERFIYDPYGQPTVLDPNWSVDTSGTDFGWQHLHQGGRRDPITGLYHFRYRDYSAALGRWINPDPAGYIDGANLYQALNSRPTIDVDAYGLAGRREGHHIVPWSLFDGLVSPETHEVFNSRAGRLSEPGYTWHNRKKYNGVKEEDYRNAVKQRLDDFLKNEGITLKSMKPEHAVKFLKQLRRENRNSPIGRYLSGVMDEIDKQLGRIPENETPAAAQQRRSKQWSQWGKRITIVGSTVIASLISSVAQGALGYTDNPHFKTWRDTGLDAMRRKARGEDVSSIARRLRYGDLYNKARAAIAPSVGDETNDGKTVLGVEFLFEKLADSLYDLLLD